MCIKHTLSTMLEALLRGYTHHCSTGRLCVMASQFRWTSKSVERYDGTNRALTIVKSSTIWNRLVSMLPLLYQPD